MTTHVYNVMWKIFVLSDYVLYFSKARSSSRDLSTQVSQKILATKV